MKFSVVALAAVMLAAAPVAAAPDKIDALVTRAMDKLHVPGLAVAVVRAGKIEKVAAFGLANLEWQVPATLDTRFQIASTTKIFTGTLLMLLAQEGKLALADPISKYIPDAPSAWRGITVGHLAAHASGIPDVFDPQLASVGDAYKVIRDKPLTFAIGAKDAYANGDFIVLSLILERVTGLSYPELVRKRLIEPLGLTCTSFEDAREVQTTRTAQVIPHRASVYRWDTDHQTLHWFLYPPYTYAMGGAFSCISDLAKWAVAMDEGKLLSTATQRRAATPFRLTNGNDAGFGAVFSVGTLRGRRLMAHSGGPALGDIVRLPDDKLTVIVLSNQQRMNPSLALAIAGLLLPDARDAAIRDTHVDWSRRLRAIADGLPTGRIDPASLAPAARDELGSALATWGPTLAGSWPAIDRWTLVGERKDGANMIRVYRAHHDDLPVRWTLTLDSAGLLVDLDAKPD